MSRTAASVHTPEPQMHAPRAYMTSPLEISHVSTASQMALRVVFIFPGNGTPVLPGVGVKSLGGVLAFCHRLTAHI